MVKLNSLRTKQKVSFGKDVKKRLENELPDIPGLSRPRISRKTNGKLARKIQAASLAKKEKVGFNIARAWKITTCPN
jgi:hypothetical protein